jgi:adenylosuccinate synthase
MSTDSLFRPGKLTTVIDASAGSSGKGKIASYLTENAQNWQFACNTFFPQAGHWVRLDDGREFFYQTLNACAYMADKYEKIYVGPGSIIELPALLREIEENRVPTHKLGISPMAAILEDSDVAFERGQLGFDGAPLTLAHEGTMKNGSTCHGVGSVNARRVLRRPSLKLAKDIPQLKPFICNVQDEILARLDQGQAGLLEIAQGFQLSLLYDRFYPNVTSRNVTVAQGLSDMFLPPRVAGPLVINLRTFPIRINNFKFIGEDGKHLTWAEVQAGVPHTKYEGNSGAWYEDQKEISWEQLTAESGSPNPIIEMTSVTKLPRRVATFSKQNLDDAIRYNDAGQGVYLSLNFANYIDYKLTGAKTVQEITPKALEWMRHYLGDHLKRLRFIGTGAKTSETVLVTAHDLHQMYGGLRAVN